MSSRDKESPQSAEPLAAAAAAAGAAAPRPSRRALHRRAVKAFNERRRNGDRRRAASERDGRLFLSSTAPAEASERARVVLVGRWDFDFFFRTMPSDLLETAPPRAAPLYSEAEQSLVCVAGGKEGSGPSGQGGSGPSGQGGSGPSGQGGSSPGAAAPCAALSQCGAQGPKSVHVRRVGGAPPLPMEQPIRAGTDLDDAPRSYLVPDTLYNVHQHAPGFERDEGVATRALFTSALQEWRGGDDGVLVLTNGETMRSVFDSAGDGDKPLVLRARRIGPTLLVDSHGASAFPLTRVRDLRGKALLGKALYRIREETLQAERDAAGAEGSVALPTHRVGSAAVAKERYRLSRHSHILCWEIGEMDVMVGLDTPLVLDRRDNTEQMLKLEDASVEMTPQEARRDVLGSWFDATLANVAHVGIYVHNDGIVQRYEVRKVQDMLGLVEGRTATAAMNFTTNVLQWLVSQCTKDGTTYAVLRNYGSDVLEIYECANDDRLDRFLVDGEEEDDDDDNDGDGDDDEEEEEAEEEEEKDEKEKGNKGKEEKEKCGKRTEKGKKKINERHRRDPHDGSETVDSPTSIESINDNDKANDDANRITEDARHRNEETDRINLGLANMCFRMGMHLKDSDAKTHDAISLLLRSFAIYLQMPTRAEAMRAVCDTAAALPPLIARFVDSRRAALGEQGAGAVQLPEIHRDALLTCGRFQVRLQDAVADASLPLPMRRAFLHSLVSCGAALCVCVAKAMTEFRAERAVSKRMRAAAGGQTESSVHIRSLITKDLLQVVVEGLLRLEHISRLLAHSMNLVHCTREVRSEGRQADAQKQSMKQTQKDKDMLQEQNKSHEKGKEKKSEEENPNNVKDEGEQEGNNEKEKIDKDNDIEGSGPKPSPASQFALIDPATDLLDIAPLDSALWELYGDVVLLAMGDGTPFTVEVLEELSRRIAAREERRSRTDPSALTHQPATTLAWLSSMKHDVVALSFTALRFFTKAGTQSKRLLAKTAQVYYHVGHHYLLTDRYTKALESLHRAQSLFRATARAPADAVFGEVCGNAVSLRDVRRSLGETYARMARLRAAFAARDVVPGALQPIAFGAAQPLAAEEEALFRHAVDHLSGADAGEALAATLRAYAARLIAHVASTGAPADAAKGRHIFAMLRRAAELAMPSAAAQRDDWEVLRLATCAAPHAALLRRAEGIAAQWAAAAAEGIAQCGGEWPVAPQQTEGGPIVQCGPFVQCGGDWDAAEAVLQLALVAAARLEAQRGPKGHRPAALARECAAFLSAALQRAQTSGTAGSAALRNAVAAWRARCTHEWTARVAVRVALRAARAAGRCLPADKVPDARRVEQRLAAIEENFPVPALTPCDGACAFTTEGIPALLLAVADMGKW